MVLKISRFSTPSITTDMIHFFDFPVEVMSLIFQETWELYQLDDPPLKKKPRRIFPFNAAAVCYLWLNVLKSQPRYWKRVTFDVEHDPTPFLDTLGLYAGGDIDVCVVSTSKSRITESQEKSRVQKIYTRLQPRLSICSSIEFDLVFQSSLPSSAAILTHHIPCLSSLSLHCQVHNCDDNCLDIKIDKNKNSQQDTPHSLSFSALRQLSLTGYSFMELGQLRGEWTKMRITDFPQSSLHLSVNHFKFHRRGPWDKYRSPSLYVFLQIIALGAKYKKFELVLTDISIEYRPNTEFNEDSMPCTSIKFENVSRNFIFGFFGSFSAPERRFTLIHFDGCSIPYIPNYAWTQTDTLIIGHTPFRKSTKSKSSLAERLDDSLCNAVSAFQPAHLILRSCEDLDDAFFDWYCEEEGDICGCGLTNLDIADCNEFNARALCNFVRHRAEGPTTIEIPEVSKLCVKGGRNTLLAKDDAEWFRSMKRHIDVNWTVSYRRKVGEEYLKTFYTHEDK